MMRRDGKVLRALACALVLVANGAGALAQDKRIVEKAAQEGTPPGNVVISAMPRVAITSPNGGGVAVGGQGGVGFTFVESEMSFDSKVIKGAPFSADAVTESVQTLGDGNRITHSSTAKLYRDGEGRTRREQTLGGVGALTASGETPQTVFINDPVAGTTYILNTREHTAQKAMQFSFKREGGGEGGAKAESNYTFTRKVAEPSVVISGGRINGKAQKSVQPTYPAVARAAGAEGGVDVEVVVDEQGNVESAKAVSGHPLLLAAAVDAARQWVFSPTLLQGKPTKVKGVITFEFALSNNDGGSAKASRIVTQMPAGEPAMGGNVIMRTTAGGGDRKELPHFAGAQESLGTQSIEGVQAEGTRTTVTIPAGAMGNERPLLIVSERWYSAELQTVVMTKHSDPRFGETTYRLTNISRSEPDHSLFEVPAGYNVTEGRGNMERMMMSLPRKPQP
jgi:TonB family protein